MQPRRPSCPPSAMTIITYDPKTGIFTSRTASPTETSRLCKENAGRFSDADGEPMFLQKFRSSLWKKFQAQGKQDSEAEGDASCLGG